MAQILASFLGWKFIDASELIFFTSDGKLDEDKTLRIVSHNLGNVEHAMIP